MDYKLSPNVTFGKGSIDTLGKFKNENIVIVTDPFMAQNGSADMLASKMPEASVSVFSEIKPDPTVDQVANCTKFVKEHDAKIIIAFGGGSAIDTAKGVVLVLAKEIARKDLTFVAIPTTSGTGSEVTSFTVITNSDNGVKTVVIDDIIVPDLAILDYTLTMSVPPQVTANTGMDVITHALEAYIAVGATPISDALAEKACALAFKSLLNCYRNGNDEQAREDMQMASYIAGLSFTTAGLGITHGIAHAVGATFHVPHGLANAILLPYVLAFNSGLDKAYSNGYTLAAEKLAYMGRHIGLMPAGVRQGVNNLIDEINRLNMQMKIPRTFMQSGIKRTDYLAKRDEVIAKAVSDMCTKTNPREVNPEIIGRILDKSFGGY